MKMTRCLTTVIAVAAIAVGVRADELRNSPGRDVRDPQRLLALGRANDAIGALQQRISQNANDVQAWHLLSRAYMAEEQWDKAIDAGEKAVAIAPSSADFHMWLGRAYGEK